MTVNQLRHVLIAGRNHHRATIRSAFAGQRAYYVVGFDALDTQQRQTQCLDAGMQRRDLHAQVVRHGRAMGFIFFKHGVAKGRAFGVKHHRYRAIRILFAQALEHVEHAFDRARGQAFGCHQGRQCVEGSVKIGGAID